MVKPMALVGMLAPLAVAARFTRNADAVVGSVLNGAPARPALTMMGPCECNAPVP